MTDEEKKAIEYWKTYMEILHWNTQLASEYYIKILLNLIEKQSKEIEELKKYKKYYEEMEEVNKKFIAVDKIKAKIEEVEKWGLYNMKIPKLSTLDERLGAKIGIKYVLQSLLEKE